MSVAPDSWTLIIKPRRHWLNLQLGELWGYRDLIVLLVWRDFAAQYKQTILGPVWYLIQPLMTTLTFTVIFGNIARLPTDGLPQFLFYMTGTTIWNYFVACLTRTSSTFIANSGIFGKVYFPRLCIPISVLFSNAATLVIQLAQLLAFMLYFWLQGATIRPSLQWLALLPLLLVMMAGFGLGFGIIISALTTRYRDLQFVVTFGAQLLMYATPVIYPLSSIPPEWRPLIALNPMTAVVEGFRLGLLGAGTVGPLDLLYSFVVMVVVLLIGVLTFTRVEDTFMDTV